MSKEISVRLVENSSMDVFPYKTNDMKIRELCDRVYFLIQRCQSPSKRSLIEIISEVNNLHPQYIFEAIYQHIRNRYFESLQKLKEDPNAKSYVIERNNEFFLARYELLREVLELFKLHDSYREIPHYLRKKITLKMFESLFEDLPRLRILYTHRHNPSPYRSNLVETVEILQQHYDEEPIPPFISHIFIHRIYKYQGNSIKVWEILPKQLKHQTPVCLIPTFGANYYSFHIEGNNSIDYHLVKNGSRVFVLDHDWDEQDANLDIYAEYLLTTLIDFIKRRTNLPQVIFCGHGLGGTMLVFKTILDAVQRPHFVTSIKAMILLNTPINFSSNYYLPPWIARLGEVMVDVVGRKGKLPISRASRVAALVPGLSKVLTIQFNRLKWLQKIMKLDNLDLINWWEHQFQLNPMTTNATALKKLLAKGITNPPRMVLKHLINMMKSDVDGVVSYNFEELYLSPGEELFDVERDWEQNASNVKATIGINYTANLHRVPSSIPVFVLQSQEDVVSPPGAFYRFWNKWPAINKLRLDSHPDDFRNQEKNCQIISDYIREKGMSSIIGVTCRKGRHLDSLINQKRLVSTFVTAVEQRLFSPVELMRTEMESYQHLLENSEDMQTKITCERDLAKKIRYLDSHFFWSEQKELLKLLLQVIVKRPPIEDPDQQYKDFMTRDQKEIESNEDLKFDVLNCCVTAIATMEPEAEPLLEQLLEILQQERGNLADTSYRALIDLCMILYDQHLTKYQSANASFLGVFERFLEACVKHPSASVALHAVRGFFHTRDVNFVQKGAVIYKNLPSEWRKKTYYIYWNEINKLISEVRASKQEHHDVSAMQALIDFYDLVESDLQKNQPEAVLDQP